MRNFYYDLVGSGTDLFDNIIIPESSAHALFTGLGINKFQDYSINLNAEPAVAPTSGAGIDVGYFDAQAGSSPAYMVNELTDNSYNAVNVATLTSASLSGLDALYLLNPDNSTWGLSTNQINAVEAAVYAGLDLVIFDRNVTDAGVVLPGSAGITFVRNTSIFDLDVHPSAPAEFLSTFGTINDTTFDNGNSSAHGYIPLASLPAGAIPLLTNGTVDQIVAFTYDYGGGTVFYSTIPLDFYSDQNNADITPAEVSIIVGNALALNACATLFGTNGDDTINGDACDNEIFGLAGFDLIRGREGNDIIYGDGAGDRLIGNQGNDFLYGGNGNDRLWGGEDADLLDGGTGTDSAYYSLATSGVTINLTTGVHGGEAVGDIFVSIERYYGSDFNDSITGAGMDDFLRGLDANDIINGEGGNDRLFGDDGNDTLNGGEGNDRLSGGNGNDFLYGGNGNDNALIGGAGNDFLFGQGGNDVLRGGLDEDRLAGGQGDDILLGGTGADRFVFSGNNTGSDRIRDFEDNIDIIDLAGNSITAAYNHVSGNWAVFELDNGGDFWVFGMDFVDVLDDIVF